MSLLNYKIQFSWRTWTMACSSEHPPKKNQIQSSHWIEWVTISISGSGPGLDLVQVFFWIWSRSGPIEEPSAFPLSPLDISTQLSSSRITKHPSLEILVLRWVRAGIKVVSMWKFWLNSSSCCEMQASSWAASSGKHLWFSGGGHLRFGIIWMLLGRG